MLGPSKVGPVLNKAATGVGRVPASVQDPGVPLFAVRCALLSAAVKIASPAAPADTAGADAGAAPLNEAAESGSMLLGLPERFAEVNPFALEAKRRLGAPVARLTAASAPVPSSEPLVWQEVPLIWNDQTLLVAATLAALSTEKAMSTPEAANVAGDPESPAPLTLHATGV